MSVQSRVASLAGVTELLLLGLNAGTGGWRRLPLSPPFSGTGGSQLPPPPPFSPFPFSPFPFSPFPFFPFFRHLGMLLCSSPFFLSSMDKFDDHVKGREGNISTSAMASRRRLEVVFPLQETSDELMILNFARLICSVVSYLQRRAFHGEMSLQGYDGPYR